MSASFSVPSGSAAALICDTGALLDYLVASAPDHRRFRNAIDEARTLLTRINALLDNGSPLLPPIRKELDRVKTALSASL